MKRAAGVADAVEYFDDLRADVLAEDADANPWGALTDSEVAWIRDQIRRCSTDFRYGAGNYFWISTKRSTLELFDLWDSQEMILDVIFWLWNQGLAAWVMICKARQLGCSTLIESLMAWKTLFFENIVAMIVADNPGQSSYLFRIMQNIYDHMPWWLRPMQYSRERKDIIILDNPDDAMRRTDPGLNNMLIAQSANKMTSVGQGKPLHACHLSEISSWFPEDRARDIIHGDIIRALVELPGNFCVMESTPKGVGDFWHDCWRTFVEDGRNAQFFPLFLPAFFEDSRRRKVPSTFQLTEEETKMKERYAAEWHRCDGCGKPVYANWSDDAECFGCGSTKNSPVMLDDDQIAWYRFHSESAKKLGREAYKDFLQEMAVTAEEGFQYSGYQVFPDDCMRYLTETCRPGTRGFFDDNLTFHSGKACTVCGEDHTTEELPMELWELPEEKAKYVAGVDVAEGEDEGDYSVIHLVKIGYGTKPDVQVLQYRGHVDPLSLGKVCYIVGRAYNDALLSIEAHGPGETTQWEVMQKMNYPHIFNWLVLDKFGNPRTHKAGWWTNERTRPQLIATGIRWLRSRLWEVRSLEFLREAPFFVKSDWAAQGRAMHGKLDDSIMAGLIAIHTAHIDDFDPNTGRIVIPADRRADRLQLGVNWTCVCVCGRRWDVTDPRGELCPDCKRPVQRAERKKALRGAQQSLETVAGGPTADPRTPDYDCL